MAEVQVQGVHHITLNGADKKTSVDFWEGILGMPLIMEQPNLDDHNINHLYFDAGDGRTLTVFTDESRTKSDAPLDQAPGTVHHVAFWISQASIRGAVEKLRAAGYASTEIKDRGFMDSIYFRDPLGLLIELASYNFDPPHGKSHGDVLKEAHQLRVARGGLAIQQEDVAQALLNITHT